MKTAVRAVQIFVGVLFIISGMVKANDPLGLSYKMQEFFELWGEGFSQDGFVRNSLDFFHRSSLALSIIMITLEVVAGVALLLAWKKKAILWLLFALIIFFTFLTGYAYLSGRFTNCGCFGDCLPITPLTSFLKDVLLTALIGFLLSQQLHLTAVFNPRLNLALLAISLVSTIGLQWYVLNYLPLADCLPFKTGNNVSQQMKPPVGSRPDSVVINFVYEKGGKRYEFAATELPADLASYKYVDRVDKVVRKGNADPPIKGFSLVGESGVDSTEIILSAPTAVVVFFLDDAKSGKWMENFRRLADAAAKEQQMLYVASSSIPKTKALLKDVPQGGLQFFNTDFTAVRTVARTSPTIVLLRNGTVQKKWGKAKLGAATDEFISGHGF